MLFISFGNPSPNCYTTQVLFCLFLVVIFLSPSQVPLPDHPGQVNMVKGSSRVIWYFSLHIKDLNVPPGSTIPSDDDLPGLFPKLFCPLKDSYHELIREFSQVLLYREKKFKTKPPSHSLVSLWASLHLPQLVLSDLTPCNHLCFFLSSNIELVAKMCQIILHINSALTVFQFSLSLCWYKNK